MRIRTVSTILLFIITEIIHANPQNTVIAWDLHGVLLENTRSSISRGYCALKYKYDYDTREFDIQKAFARGDHARAVQIIKISNEQKPRTRVATILQSLHHHGYKNYIISNIGRATFDDLSNRAKYPVIWYNVLRYFDLDHPQIMQVDPYRDRRETVIRKPFPQAFRDFLRNNNINIQTTRVIFIDDSATNVAAACKEGFIGIRYKNPEQLRKELAKLHIDI